MSPAEPPATGSDSPQAGPAQPVTPHPEAAWRRGLRAWPPVVRALREAPLTVGLTVLLWVVGAATGSLGSGPSPHLLSQVGVGIPTLEAGRWWTPVSSLLWCSGTVPYLLTTAALLIIGPLAERRLGRRRAGAVLIAGQVVGVLVGTGLVRLGIAVGETWTQGLNEQIAVGPAPGLFALAGALSFRLTALWRRRLQLVVVLVPLVLMLYVGHLQAVQRLVATVLGLVAGLLLARERVAWRPRRPSHAETRVLVALCVAGSALGPLVASLYRDAYGPFNTFSDLYFSRPPSAEDIAYACSVSADECAHLKSALHFFDSPGRLMAALVPVLLLVLAEGLRRGLRLAWWCIAVVQLLWIALLSWLLEVLLGQAGDLGGPSEVWQLVGEALLMPVLVLLLLLITRKRFSLRLPARDLKRLGLVIGGTLLAACLAYVGIGWLVRDQYNPDATLPVLLRGLPSEFLPPAYNDLILTSPVAVGGTSQALTIYAGLLFWVVTLLSLLLAFRRPSVQADAADAARARELLTRHGGSTLSFIATWDGNHYWFDEGSEAAVPYRVISTVALTTGDPFGEPTARRRAVAGFAAYCDARGWTPCFYSVTPQTLDEGERLGWRSLQVAEDTVVPLADLAFTGKKWQDIRTSLNKARKEGITAEWWSWQHAPLAVRDQVRSISEEWVADKGLPEMGFTLGGLDELADPAVRILIAIDQDRTVHGLTSWMPVYRDGEPIGWTLDFMRRRADGFRGVMEFLIASAALGFKEEGAEFLSLSGAPLARADRGVPQTALQRMLDWMGKSLEPVYGFRSLLAFKAKFQPEYRPMYMLYPDPAALPNITRAIGKAYLPHLTPGQGMRLMRRLSG
ncbi:bifunctional lysylphosphatidylglycerol flippase/synthetase MprF [Kitasatospora sp. NPDC008050]|uniref:bifunctional lysylphosphatidylglycerol flippase/synthetase MprF n=1 Tax=Kitasatospora sp. NPDC008050 TaxID=3364021 RepID=UPI0036E05D3E